MEIIKNKIYKHFKGDYYLVEDIAKDSETQEEMVIYRKLYEDCALWIRPKKMFLSEGTVRNNISALLLKLKLRDRTQLAVYAVKNDYI